MLPLEARKYLYDIRGACELLTQFTDGKTFADYRAEPMLRSAVERQFEVIGEAVRQLIKDHPEMAGSITDHQRIISFRNRLIHGYADVSDEVVWGVLESNLLKLKQEVQDLLTESNP